MASVIVGFAQPTRINLDGPGRDDTIALWVAPTGSPQTITTAGIPSSEAPGAVGVAAAVTPAAIPSGEALGAVAVTPGAVTVAPAGIGSGELFGAVSAGGPGTLAPAGIASSESVGNPAVSQVIAPAGIASGETPSPAPLVYQTYTGTTANGDPWKLWVPASAGANTPLVHFAHAYGGSYLDPDTATYVPYRSAVIAAGWALVSTAYSGGAPDQAWGAPVIASGNQRAVETCFMQADAAAKAAVPAPVTLVTKLAYGGSMGCINLLDAFRYETGITTLAGMYAVCGVFNLADLYAGAHTGHINTAYNIPTGGTYAAQTAGRDPNLATATQNAGPTGATRFRHLFSAGDEVCRPDLNAAPFVSSFAGLAGVQESSAIVALDSGVHLQGYAVGAEAAADFVSFGRRAIAGTDALAADVPATPTSVAGTLTGTQNQITWLDPATPAANLAGWNVYVNGAKKNVSLITRDITGTWLRTKGNTATSTTWTDTVNSPFVVSHLGQPFYGDHVPQGTVIAAILSSSQVTLSQATTATDNTLSRLRYVSPLPLFTITGLSPNTSYTVTLRSVTIDGVESADSTPLNFTTSGGIGPAGIPTREALGSPTVTPGTVTVAPAGVPSEQRFGTITVPPATTITAGGIPSAQAVGTATLAVAAGPIPWPPHVVTAALVTAGHATTAH